MQGEEKSARFERLVMPHTNAAYNLVRWLTHNDTDAEDIVQESFLRAFKFFGGFHGENGRAWLLTIVRHTCYTWLHQNRAHELTMNDEIEFQNIADDALNPEMLLLENVNRQLLKQALETLPVEFREVMVLREFEELSYKEIADISDLPIGTVMSRLARARKKLHQCLAPQVVKEV